MAQPNQATYPNLDLSQAYDLADVEEYLADPQVSCQGDIVIPVAKYDPIYPFEAILGERFSCATDPDTELPFMTFGLGSTNTSLMNVYEKRFSTAPSIIIARVAIKGAEAAEVTYVVPVAVTGHRAKAVTSTQNYSPTPVKTRGGNHRYELGRNRVAPARVAENPFYVKTDAQPASRFFHDGSNRARTDASIVGGIRRGSLGTN